MLRLAVLLGLMGVVFGQTDGMPEETSWDCRVDHQAVGPDNDRFLQSPNGFGEGAAVSNVACASPVLAFTIMPNGSCACLYRQEVADILAQSCQVRRQPGMEIDEYDSFTPNLQAQNSEDLFVRQTCHDSLPEFAVNFYLNLGIRPMFFDMDNCRCNWTAEGLANLGEALLSGGSGQLCERLADWNFADGRLSQDEIGNTINAFPSEFQNNGTVRGGGTVFGQGLVSAVGYSLQGVDFANFILFARFDADVSEGQQVVLSNVCQEGEDGIVQLMYNPRGRQYTLEFFSAGRTATCSSASPAGIQAVQVIYSEGDVRLVVNNVECDVSSLNPIADTTDRLRFSSNCPFQLGGTVFSDVVQLDSGRSVSAVRGLQGVLYRFMALRNCDNPPSMVRDRLDGSV